MNLRQSRATIRAGFTLLEMMVVVAILVILVGAGTVSYLKVMEDARRDMAKRGVQVLTQTAEMYQLRFGEYPATLAVLSMPTPEGGRPYLEPAALIDPWGKEYQYSPQGQNNALSGKPDVWAVTPKGEMVGNWSGTQVHGAGVP